MPKKSRRRRGPSKSSRPSSAPPAPATEPSERTGISWLGAIGGVAGGTPLAALGIEVLVDPPEAGRWPAAILLSMAVVYLPAVWASVAPTPRRRAIQRSVVAASIAMVLVGLPFFGAPFAVVLLPATGLLAVASGLVFGR